VCASLLLFNTSHKLAYLNAELILIKRIHFKHLAKLTGWRIGTYNTSRGTATSIKVMITLFLRHYDNRTITDKIYTKELITFFFRYNSLRMALLNCCHYNNPIDPLLQCSYITMTPTKRTLQSLPRSTRRSMETILVAAVSVLRLCRET